MHLMTLGGSKKISGAMCRCLAVSLTGYYVAVCVCVMILLAEVSNISQRQVTPSVFW